MKLKTSHLFSLDLFCKFIILAGFVATCSKAYSQEQDYPGVVESLERLLQIHRKQYDENKLQSQNNMKVLTNLSDLKEVNLDPQFIKSLLFHSDDKYLQLINKNECRFLSLIENNLIKSIDGEVENIFITYKNKDNQIEHSAVPKTAFFEQIYKLKCLNNVEYSTLFNTENLQKTIEGIKFSVPKNSNECNTIHQEWIENAFTPYLCRLQQDSKKSKNQKEFEIYKTKIPVFQRTYLESLCTNLNSPELFCYNYLKKDAWNKVLNGELPGYKMNFKCQNLLNKDMLDSSDLRNCAAKLNSEKELCESKGNRNFLSDFPLQNCDTISEALNKSKLVTNYHDCPGNIDNEAITNIHRIINHFNPRKINSDKESCASEAQYSYAKLSFNLNHEERWPLKVCFKNRVTNKEECTPYIPGARESEPISEDQVISKILYSQKGASAKTKCRIVDSKTYNPIRSDFKFGCFIVYESETCSNQACSKKIIWEGKIIEDIKFVGKPLFDYFPSTFINERNSFVGMMNEINRTQSRGVKNLTDLKFFLDNSPNGIIHGVGCSEDLIPEEFYRNSINQCHPLPFIIDGYVQKNGEINLVFRSAIDDLHSPRLILWQNIYNSVSAYKELHPLNTWTLYGIKK